MDFDFANNTKVDSIDKVPADFRGLYKETKDGDKTVHVLDSDNAQVKSAVAAITGLNTSLKAARAEAKNGKVDLSPLKDYGATPDEIAAKIAEQLKGLQEQIKGVNVDKIKSDITQEWDKKVKSAEGRAASIQKSFHDRVVVGDAKAELAAAKGDIELALPFVLQQTKTMEKDGSLNVFVVDTAGDIRYSGVTGAPMTVKELVAEMKGQTKYGKLFASDAPNGGGTKPGSTQRPNPVARVGGNTAEMTATEKIAFGLSRGLAAGKRSA